MAGAYPHLPRFPSRAHDIFEATQQIRPLGAAAEFTKRTDRISDAEERGRLQAEEVARLELERVRAEDRADFEMRLAEARQRWAEETADALAGKIATGLDAISTALVDRLGRVLAPFLGKAVRERAIDELTETVLALLHSGRHVVLTVSGPKQLLERLRPDLAAWPHTVEYTEGAPDVRVAIDDTVVETQIGAWIARIEAALAGEPHG